MIWDENDTNSSTDGNWRWLVSFGDLLTLLLVFFLSIVSFGTLNPSNDGSSNSVTARTDELTVPKSAESASNSYAGTEIANLESVQNLAERKVEVVLRENDFLDAAKFADGVREKLITGISKEGYATHDIHVAACAPAAEHDAWFDSIARSLGIRSQLLDAGIERNSISLQVLGRFCKGIRANDKDSVVVVSAKLVEEKHG